MNFPTMGAPSVLHATPQTVSSAKRGVILSFIDGQL